MSPLRTSIFIAWGVFWLYWLISAAGAKKRSRTTRIGPVGVRISIIIAAVVLIRVLHNRLLVHAVTVQVVGAILFVFGLGLAVWARVHLGRNWGMPMTEKEEPELVTSGPYRLVRHPIYSGIVLAMLGTALATYVYLLVVFALMLVYFVYSARVEERLLAATFPDTYPSYRAGTKMLIPFLL